MNSRKKIILLGVIVIAFLVIFNVSLAQTGMPGDDPTAYPTWGDVDSGDSGGGVWNVDNFSFLSLPGASVVDIIDNLATWLVGIFAFFGIIGFTISGIIYLTSTGDDEMISKAKKYMMYSILGVIVGLSGFVILQAVDAMLNAGLF